MSKPNNALDRFFGLSERNTTVKAEMLAGLTIGEYTVPRLATVCQDVDALAISSIHMLLESISHPGQPRHETVPVTVTLRSSAGPAGEQ